MASRGISSHSKSPRRSHETHDHHRQRLGTSSSTHHDSRHDESCHHGNSLRPDRHIHHQRSRSRVRRRWPPQPSVEEETVALAKELGTLPTHDVEVMSRGTIEQDPILIDVANPMKHTVSDRGSTLTPPTSDDERFHRGRRKAPKLNMEALPEMARTSSPYAFTKPPTLLPSRSSGEYLLSPESLTPPSTASSLPSRPPTSSYDNAQAARPKSPNKPTAHETKPAGAGHAIDDNDLDSRDAALLRSRRVPSTYSFSKPDVPISLPRGSTTIPPLPFVPHRPALNLDGRRHTESSMELPKPSLAVPVRHTSTSKGSSLAHEAAVSNTTPPATRSHQQKVPSRESTAPSSHGSHSYQYPPSPPRSPRVSGERTRDVTPKSRPSSMLASRDGSSAETSPHGSPALSGTLPSTDSGWNTAFASNAARRAHPPSRLAKTTLQDQIPSLDLRDPTIPPGKNTLPYPADDRPHHHQMPEVKDHAYNHKQTSTAYSPTTKARPPSRATTPVPPLQSSQRPALVKSHSVAEGLPLAPPIPEPTRHASTGSAKGRSPAAAATPAPLPPCPNPEYTTKQIDWFTMDRCPNFDICPDCLDSVFSKTIYRPLFKRAPRRPLGAQIKCDFSNPWVRLAYLLTLQRRSPNLNLLKALADHLLVDDQPCPEKEAAVRNWFTIRNEYGKALRSFYVCGSDVRKIEILLPHLRGLFIPHLMRISSTGTDMEHVCAMRTKDNNRFPIYIDSLISIHETYALSTTMAHRPLSGGFPDVSRFISLVRHKTDLQECTRDDLLRHASWHFIPALPFFTVCEDCYDELIQPYTPSSTSSSSASSTTSVSEIATRFTRHPTSVPHESRLGSSCQLYSARMRRVWRRALEDRDANAALKTLARKARERKETEEQLQDQVVKIRAKARRLRDGAVVGGWSSRDVAVEEERLQGELEMVADEWVVWE